MKLNMAKSGEEENKKTRQFLSKQIKINNKGMVFIKIENEKLGSG